MFEQDWKNARVSPIYKDDGDINDENNYRPISVIGHIAKMVESLVSYQIIDYLESHSFISMDQSAYLKMHSTQTCLHRVIDDWLEHINDGEITGACLLDISKCFDSINHIILLKKLEMYGIIGTELEWFSSYLDGRKQFVNFNNETSESCEMWCSTRVSSWPYFVFIVHQWHLQFCSRRLRIKYVCRRCDNIHIRNVNSRTRMQITILYW